MKIIIDGYNLIGVEGGMQGNIGKKRSQLIKRIVEYKVAKNHEIIIVFDGHKGESHYQTSEFIGGVKVVYSRIGENADSVIIKMARGLVSECVVVSSDNEIRSAVAQSGAVDLRSGDFLDKLIEFENYGSAGFEDGGWEGDDDGEPEYYKKRSKRGNPRKLSKDERVKKRVISKL